MMHAWRFPPLLLQLSWFNLELFCSFLKLKQNFSLLLLDKDRIHLEIPELVNSNLGHDDFWIGSIQHELSSSFPEQAAKWHWDPQRRFLASEKTVQYQPPHSCKITTEEIRGRICLSLPYCSTPPWISRFSEWFFDILKNRPASAFEMKEEQQPEQ